MDGRSAAAAILMQAFADSTRGFSTVGALRLVASRVAPYIHSLVEGDALDLTRMMINDPGLQEAFAENTPHVVEALGGIQGVTHGFIDQYVSSYEASIDVASLILAHSVLDAAAYQFCRASASVAASDWESMVQEKKVSLMEIREGSYEEILRSKVSDFIDSYERESLLKKVDRLFAICKPFSTSSKTYSYSRERLAAIDDLRHAIVHGRSAYSRLPEVGSDILFLQATNHFLCNMVMKRYNLPIDSTTLVQSTDGESEEAHNTTLNRTDAALSRGPAG